MTKRILIVDDSATLRAAVTSTLAQADYEVLEAIDGQVGLEVLDKARLSGQPVDLIISDINMPIMGGIEFIGRVKQGPDRFTPILVLTTESEEHMKQQGRKLGAAGWLVKPFQPPVLVKVVRKFVR